MANPETIQSQPLASRVLSRAGYLRRAGTPAMARYAVIALSLLLHAAYFAINYSRGLPSLGVDGPVYRDLALQYLNSQTLLGEQSTNVFWTPWFVVLAALGANPIAVAAWNLLVYGTTLVLLDRLASLLTWGSLPRLLLLLAYGFYWPTFDYVVFFHYELTLAFLTTAVVCSVARLLALRGGGSLGAWAALGLFAGAGLFVHTRAAAVLLLPASTLLVFRRFIPLWTLKLAVLVLLSAVPLLAWGARNKAVIGKWVVSSSSVGYNLYVGFNPVATGFFNPQPPYPPADQAFSMAVSYIRENPARSASLVGQKLIKYWYVSAPQDFGPRPLLIQEWLLMPAAALGFLISAWRSLKLALPALLGSRAEPSAGDLVLWGSSFMVAFSLAFHAAFYLYLPRFRLPVTPLLCLLAVYGLRELLLRRRGRLR